MEKLLNKLIGIGWKPFGDEKIHSFEIIYVTWKIWNIVARRWRWQVNKHYSIIELCSKSSWLRQFVCENRLWKDIDEEKYWHKKTPKMSELRSYDYHFEEYRLIESALKDESELESLILDNIKVEEIKVF